MAPAKETRYFVIKPSPKRKKFVLVAYRLENRQTKKYLSLAQALRAALSSINEQFLTKVITEAEASLLINGLIEEEYRKNKVLDRVLKNSKLSQINQKIFNQFWAKVYAIRFLADEKSPRYDILKALRLIEPLSLATASPAELLTKLKSTTKNRAEMRRAIDRLNQVIKFLERGFSLPKPPEDMREIQFLTEAEMVRVASLIENKDLRSLTLTLFASGLRLSEALSLGPGDLSQGQINVNKQLTLEGTLKLPKRGKVGRSLVIEGYLPDVEQWIRVKDKAQYRTQLFNVLGEACRRAKVKVIGPHDLRHSHAIHLLGKGATLTQVALNLRNRVDVCQKYYTGFAHTDDTLDGLRLILKT